MKLRIKNKINRLIHRLLNYMPYCIANAKINSLPQNIAMEIEPNVYNEYGERKRTFFLSDSRTNHTPYTLGSIDFSSTRYINWDRFNYRLPIHFYSHESIFKKTYSCRKKFGLILESDTIIPKLYSKALKEENIINSYDAIFTADFRLLDKYKNAHYIFPTVLWYGGNVYGGILNKERFLRKKLGVSAISSNKQMCALHKFRIHVVKLLVENNLAIGFGNFNGGSYFKNIFEPLDDFMFSVVVENSTSKGIFTEKILNCFASMTILIYCGCSNIGDYFNDKGIIHLYENMTDSEIIEVVKKCDKNKYEKMVPFIIDNFNRVLNYTSLDDELYRKYNYLFEL